jgi:aspartyl/asparaginyl-tRNA synthetase
MTFSMFACTYLYQTNKISNRHSATAAIFQVAFADINEDMELAEAFIKHTINAALVRCPGDMEILELFEKKAIETREKERKEEEKARVAAEKKRQVWVCMNVQCTNEFVDGWM